MIKDETSTKSEASKAETSTKRHKDTDSENAHALFNGGLLNNQRKMEPFDQCLDEINQKLEKVEDPYL